MSKPVDVKGFGPDALASLEQAVASAINTTSGGSATFLTGQEAIPAPPSVTQLPNQIVDGAVILRGSADFFVFSTNSGNDGFLMYEGDDIKINSVLNLDQIFVQPVKNQPLTLWWAVTGS